MITLITISATVRRKLAADALPCAPGDRLPQSLLYVPVAAGQRVLGALCVQSFAPGAYQRVHLDMLRTLAAYVGVALDNAQAYRQLKDAQSQLAAQEKLVLEHLVNAATRGFERSCRTRSLRRQYRPTDAGAPPVVLCRARRMLMLAAPEVLPTLTVPRHQPCDGTFGL